MDNQREHDPENDDPIEAAREGVVAADDTGMISNEIRIVETELEGGERAEEA